MLLYQGWLAFQRWHPERTAEEFQTALAAMRGALEKATGAKTLRPRPPSPHAPHHHLFSLLHGPLLIMLGFFFVVGACLGSFLNVCIYRIPLGISVVTPHSSCAACGAPIPPRWNIPIVSWLWLRGRSGCCGTPIDARYFWIELGSGCLLAALFFFFRWPAATIYAVLFYGLTVASMIDIDHFLIPDRLSLGGIGAGLLASALWPPLHGKATAWTGFNEGLWGAFVGGFLLWVVVVIGSKLLQKEAMGLGDVKLLAAMGAFLGWEAVFFIVSVSSVIGSVFRAHDAGARAADLGGPASLRAVPGPGRARLDFRGRGAHLPGAALVAARHGPRRLTPFSRGRFPSSRRCQNGQGILPKKRRRRYRNCLAARFSGS